MINLKNLPKIKLKFKMRIMAVKLIYFKNVVNAGKNLFQQN